MENNNANHSYGDWAGWSVATLGGVGAAFTFGIAAQHAPSAIGQLAFTALGVATSSTFSAIATSAVTDVSFDVEFAASVVGGYYAGIGASALGYGSLAVAGIGFLGGSLAGGYVGLVATGLTSEVPEGALGISPTSHDPYGIIGNGWVGYGANVSFSDGVQGHEIAYGYDPRGRTELR